MGAYDCDCINNLEYDRRERKERERLAKSCSIHSEPRWIPVSERLPEEDGKYMVTIHGYGWNGKTFTSVSVAECIGKLWVGNNGVIAWMPLPEHYKGE